MRVADKWKDYELLDCSSGQRLERWGDVILIRPDPQVIWKQRRPIRSGIRRTQSITVHLRAAESGISEERFPMRGR